MECINLGGPKHELIIKHFRHDNIVCHCIAWASQLKISCYLLCVDDKERILICSNGSLCDTSKEVKMDA